MSKIPCKYFDHGKGMCKFGSNCMYAHVDSDGNPVKIQYRVYVDSTGGTQSVNKLNLGMFVGREYKNNNDENNIQHTMDEDDVEDIDTS